MESKKKVDSTQKIADVLIQAIEAGTAPWMRPWAPGETPSPRNAVSGHRYRGVNPLLLMAAGYTDPRWIGFGQAKAKGGSVRKGEKGTPILRMLPPLTLTDKAGEPMLDKDGNERISRPAVKLLHVFNVSQVDGVEFPALAAPKIHEWDVSAKAEAALKGSGVPLNHGGDRACYSPSKDQIFIPGRSQFPTRLGYYHTALHELGHATGHHTRLGRDGIKESGNGFGSVQYAREELVAEITALMAGEQLGTGSTPQHGAAYVASWLKALKNDPKEINRAATAAQKAADWILEHTPAAVEAAA